MEINFDDLQKELDKSKKDEQSQFDRDGYLITALCGLFKKIYPLCTN